MDRIFTRLAGSIALFAGQPLAFVIALLAIIIWGITGPIFHYSDTWQLIVNTATTIITFLMVFLIQNSQNRDGAAMQAKLDELIRAVEDARGTFIGIEHLTDTQICEIRTALEADCKKEPDRYKGKHETVQHSVDRLLSRY
ncbi:low affinity iron permease family protein [Sphingomonas sp. CGMCC 1.13654]|uniref:Low affinity iron permease family protein n=1 Tax=Sphingomonas chungangi TaxID=2683589 RepID=A0A838L6D2_9SPHN|nr:low affinity iron permease family protein [Sphingomonas chungangi]MBA2934490.1 low affinity iron permease family protein [Sphingomonas chungangi]MVW57529.1 low affinity iron permease family protein [Sphingomonas chungangi]